MIAAAITNGALELKHCNLDHLIAVTDRLDEVGVQTSRENGTVFVSAARRIVPVEMTTQPYPGFPTDLQVLMALLCLSDGISVITERIFPDRFLHVGELNRMGARIRKEGPTAIIQGVRELQGASVMASDLGPARRWCSRAWSPRRDPRRSGLSHRSRIREDRAKAGGGGGGHRAGQGGKTTLSMTAAVAWGNQKSETRMANQIRNQID